MSTEKFEIKPSVRDYYQNEGIKTAVDLLLEKNAPNSIPDDLDWDEVKNYHEALLSAVTVRTDFALMMMDAWDKVWKPALDGWDDVPIKDMEKDERPTPEAIWDYDFFYRQCMKTVKKQNKYIWTTVEFLGPDEGFKLYVAMTTTESKAKNRLSEQDWTFNKAKWEGQCGELWENKLGDDGYLYTKQIPLSDKANPNIDKLIEAAKVAVTFFTNQ